MPTTLILLGVTLIVAITWWTLTDKPSVHQPTAQEILEGVEARPELVENGKSMQPPQIIKVTEGVYMAHGYAMGNCMMLEGPTGLIIVDTTESLSAARKIHKEFRRISNKPIVAIVYTHFHGDHVFGTEPFIEDNQNPPDIWAHEMLPELFEGFIRFNLKYTKGSSHQFGSSLTSHGQVYSYGLGPVVPNQSDSVYIYHSPTKLMTGDIMHVQIAGLNVTFLHIPGETKDQIAVWLPDTRVLLPADDIYRTYPNVYAIRGTPPRNAVQWHDSLEKMRKLRADFLVPSHTRPVIGQQEIYEIITVYMAGIMYVHDQTVRYMNEGLHPEEIAQRVALPRSLSSHPYLQEFYGTTQWSSRVIYENYVGWFSGDPVELFPHTPTERARYMTELIGEAKLLSRAESALKDNDPRWALELSSYVFIAQPDNHEARDVRLRSLRTLASQQKNPCARNLYLTAALDDHKLINWQFDETWEIERMEMKEVLYYMKIRVKAEEVEGVNMTVLFCFEDTNETFYLQMLYSVLAIEQLQSCSEARSLNKVYETKMITTSVVWKDIILKRRSLSTSYSKGDIKTEGSFSTLRTFVSYFKINY